MFNKINLESNKSVAMAVLFACREEASSAILYAERQALGESGIILKAATDEKYYKKVD